MPSRPLRVFLCHAHADKPAVRKLYRYLKQRGVRPWLDEIDLLPGEKWEVEIPRTLRSSDVILVCLSRNSVTKEGYVQKEITFALDKAMEKPEGTIFIIPARLEECDVPERLNSFHWVDLFHTQGYKRLMLSLNKRAAELGPGVEQAIVTDESSPVSKPKEDTSPSMPPKEEKKPEPESLPVSRPAEKLTPPVARRTASPPHAKSKPRAVFPSPVIGRGARGEGKVGYKLPARFWVILAGLAVILLCGFGVNYLVKNWPTSPAPTTTFVPAFTRTPIKTRTPTLRPPTATPTITFTPTPGIGSTWTSPKDGMVMVFVPKGKFTMGSDSGGSDEQPVHDVELDDFWIDQTEITNAMYAKCVQAGKCDPPDSSRSYTRENYYGNPEFDDYPVIHVSWNDAKTYCEWADRRLPTEAEWEKAAGWDADKQEKRVYPWGDSISCSLANYSSCTGDTTKVGSYPSGASFYGLLDMAGNVWEWVADWYSETFYAGSPASNPLGPDSGTYRVLRGGAWSNDDINVRSASRGRYDPAYTSNYFIGFRCSRSP